MGIETMKELLTDQQLQTLVLSFLNHSEEGRTREEIDEFIDKVSTMLLQAFTIRMAADGLLEIGMDETGELVFYPITK